MSSEEIKSPDISGDVTSNKASAGPPLQYEGMEETEVAFVDSGMVQFVQDGMVVLSFFQGEQPFFRSEEEYKKLEVVKVHCVTRLIMTAPQFERLLGLYGEFLRKQKELLKIQEESQK